MIVNEYHLFYNLTRVYTDICGLYILGDNVNSRIISELGFSTYNYILTNRM